MKTLIILFSLSLTCLGQNWSPMSIGNHWQYFIYSAGPDGFINNLLDDYVIEQDSIINGNQYFKFKYYLLNYNQWKRYNDLSGVEYFNYLGSDYTIMNFSLNAGEHFNHVNYYESNVIDSVIATIIVGNYNSGDSILQYKGYTTFQSWGGWDFIRDSTKYIEQLGFVSRNRDSYQGGSITTLVQALIQSDSNQIYFKQFYYPSIIYEPDTMTNSNIFNKEVTVLHNFSRLKHSNIWGWQEGVNFIDSVYLISFYSKDSIRIIEPIHFASRIPVSYKFQFNFGLDTTLMKQGYVFNYKIKAIDKFWIPNYVYLPLDFYFTLKFDATLTNVCDCLSQTFDFNLFQNYPNPFNPSTKINYSVPIKSFVQLRIYDLLGREVAALVNEEKQAGVYEVEFNAQQTTDNKQLTSGVYFYQLKAGEFIQTRKMLMLK